MHPWVRSPTLHEHVMAVARPCVRERGLDDCATVPAPAQVGMGDDVLKKAVASSAPQEVRRCDEHACRCDALALVGYKDMDSRLRQGLPPNTLGALARLGG